MEILKQFFVDNSDEFLKRLMFLLDILWNFVGLLHEHYYMFSSQPTNNAINLK